MSCAQPLRRGAGGLRAAGLLDAEFRPLLQPALPARRRLVLRETGEALISFSGGVCLVWPLKS